MARSSTTFRKGHKGYKAMLGKKGGIHPKWKGGLPKCLTCKKTITRYAKYCNRHKIFSEKHRENIGKTSKGRISWCKGKTLSIEHRKRIGESRIYPLGENHPNWMGGFSKGDYGLEWTNKLKRLIRERDRHICQICEKENSRDIHHIDYNKKNNNKNNLITLCNICHTKTNFNRTKWRLFFLKREIKNYFCKTTDTWAIILNY